MSIETIIKAHDLKDFILTKKGDKWDLVTEKLAYLYC